MAIPFLFFRRSSVIEEQITRQLIGLHRAVTHKDKNLLNQLVRQGMDMTLPLRGVTALSLSLYLRHLEMTVELLSALRRTRQIGNNKRGFDLRILVIINSSTAFDVKCFSETMNAILYTMQFMIGK